MYCPRFPHQAWVQKTPSKFSQAEQGLKIPLPGLHHNKNSPLKGMAPKGEAQGVAVNRPGQMDG